MHQSNNLEFPLINDGKVQKFFIKSNSYLLKKYYLDFKDIRDNGVKIRLLQSLWKKEFYADLELTGYIPVSIRFFDKQSATMFFLRFDN